MRYILKNANAYLAHKGIDLTVSVSTLKENSPYDQTCPPGMITVAHVLQQQDYGDRGYGVEDISVPRPLWIS